MAIVPSLGLYWELAADPTVGAGLSAPLNQLLFRTDVPSIYYKSGAADTAWTLLGTGTAGSTTTINNISAGLAGLFGRGADGDVTIGAGTTTLTRSMEYHNLTINAGGILNPAGYPVFVQNLFTGTNGSMSRGGNNGSNAAGAGAGASGAGLAVGMYSGSAAGGNGGAAGGAGSLGGNGGNVPQEYATIVGGNGGNGTQAGGGGGSVSRISETSGRFSLPQWAMAGRPGGSSTLVGTAGAGGGGGGGGAGGTSGGGGGGGGGGFLSICARIVACQAAFSFITKGGNGGNAGANGGNAGGGGGGMGGPLVLIYSVDNGPTSPPTTNVVGGTGGNPTGTGIAGQNGGDGPLFRWALSGAA